MALKGHWTSSTSSPNFFPKKVGIFIPLEVLAWVMTACRVLRSRLNLLLKIYEHFCHFLFFKVDFNKYTIQQPMGQSEDDAVNKIPHKMKTHWRNQLKFSALV